MAYATILTSTSFGILLLPLASNFRTASAAPSPNGFTDLLLPSPNVTGGPVAEIQCYALPYGAVGIISHLLTYWTFAWMAIGKIPLWPWHKMTSWRFDLFLAILALCTCIPIASITIHRCRLSWHFILISVWKLITSVSLACMSIHRCILVYKLKKKQHNAQNAEEHQPLQHLCQDTQYYACPSETHQMYSQRNNSSFFRDGQRSEQQKNDKQKEIEEREDRAPLWWLLLYLGGTVVGMVGLCSLLWTTFRDNKTVKRLTYAFVAPMVLVPILVGFYWFQKHLDGKGGRRVLTSAYWYTFASAVLAFTAVFGFFSALYADLVLGAIADNLLGLPSADFAPLFWIWFFAKRLPLLSF